MTRTTRRRIAAIAVAATMLVYAGKTSAAEKQKKLPNFSEIEKTVQTYFAKTVKLNPGEIISCSQVKPIFRSLAALGWEVADEKEILEAVPADGEFIVKQLRTKGGRKFARQISGMRNGYDRVDRLSRLPHGKQTIKDLIRGPDGYKMIEYMTGSSGGNELGKMLSKDPGGADFNSPTGKLYTVKSLILRLKASYAAATQKPVEKR